MVYPEVRSPPNYIIKALSDDSLSALAMWRSHVQHACLKECVASCMVQTAVCTVSSQALALQWDAALAARDISLED